MRSGRIGHDGDPVLAWISRNIVRHYNGRGERRSRKERPKNKVAGAIALIMAIERHMVARIGAHCCGGGIGTSSALVTKHQAMAYAAGLGVERDAYLNDLREGGIIAAPAFVWRAQRAWRGQGLARARINLWT